MRDDEGLTPLLSAVRSGEDVDEKLAGSFKKTGNYEGNTPLHYAIKTQNSVVAIVLAQRFKELMRKKTPNAVYLARSSYGIRKTEMKDSANALSVVPGGFDEDDGSPVFMAKWAFTIFVVANTITMHSSMLCLFLLLWVMGI
ncbi:RNA-directed RNA polymerase, partial [Bienertia sinuspersici]